MIDHGDQVIDLLDGSVAFPIAADEELAGFDGGGGVEGAFGDLGGGGGGFGGGVGEHD